MATYYVRSSGGSNANTGLSFAQGWATIQYAFDNLASGDDLLVCADGAHIPASKVVIDNVGGLPRNFMTIKGVSATGVDDGTRATILANNVGAGPLFEDNGNGVMDYWTFENLIVSEGTNTSVTILFRVKAEQAPIRWVNVRLDGATQSCVKLEKAVTHAFFLECEFLNGSWGIECLAATGVPYLSGCWFHDLADGGVELGLNGAFYCCAFADIVGPGIRMRGNETHLTVHNCLMHKCNEGIFMDAGLVEVSYSGGNNIFTSNTNWGVNLSGSAIAHMTGPNLYWDNGIGDATIDGVTDEPAAVDTSGTPILADPLYTNSTIGSYDFALAPGSPALRGGLPGSLLFGTGYMTMGPLQPPREPGVHGKDFGMQPHNRTTEIIDTA